MRVSIALLAALCAAFGLAASAGAAPTASAHGQLLHIQANTNESSNWFGYNLGSLALGGTLFNSITGDWTVPTASSHTARTSSPPTGSESAAAASTPTAPSATTL
jgi:hypothetical protein